MKKINKILGGEKMERRTAQLLIIMLGIMLILAGCGAKDEANSVETNNGTSSAGGNEDNLFRVGMEAGYPPFNWTQMDDSNGGVPIEGLSEYAGGYDVEIAKRIAEGLGKQLVVVKTEWDGLVPALQSGKIDAIIAGMSPTEERKQVIDFSEPYYKSDLVMVVKKGSPYENATSIQDFAGAKITAQLNTFHYTVIDQIQGVNKQPAMDNFPAMRVALEAGMIDGYVSERPEGVSASAANDNFVMVEFIDGFVTTDDDTAISVGLVKGNEYLERINEILSGISEEERLHIMDEAIKNQPASGE